MPTYCIGDVQGCYAELEALMHTVNYTSSKDHLWFVGDLVNRGPKSLEVLRLVKELPNTKIVLGNHDLHLLNFYHKIVDFEAGHLEPILTAPDGRELVEWLRQQPLLYYSQEHHCVVVHAGIYPGWNLKSAVAYAKEAENMLRGKHYLEFLKYMYGNTPTKWQASLSGWERLRFIINAFTRMRFCDLDGNLEFLCSGQADRAPPGYLPWFKISGHQTKNTKIIFGHWAALEGKTDEPNAIALDTGCVWGHTLTALRIEDGAIFSTPAINKSLSHK